MIHLHSAPLSTDLIPDLNTTMSQHVFKKFEIIPSLVALVSTYEQFSSCLSALNDALHAPASEIGLQAAKAFELSCSPFAKLRLKNMIGDDEIGQKTWNELCLIDKVPKAFYTFRVALEQLPQLRFVKIVFLEAPDNPPCSVTAPQSLKETMRRCGLSPNVTALRANINKHINMEHTQTIHKQFQNLSPMVHTKVRVIAHLLQEGSGNMFSHLAVNTKPCFLCHHFAQQFHFKTREPEFNQYSTWNLPEVPALNSDKFNKLVDAVHHVVRDMRAQLLIPIEGGREREEGHSASSGSSNAATGPGQQAASEFRS